MQYIAVQYTHFVHNSRALTCTTLCIHFAHVHFACVDSLCLRLLCTHFALTLRIYIPLALITWASAVRTVCGDSLWVYTLHTSTLQAFALRAHLAYTHLLAYILRVFILRVLPLAASTLAAVALRVLHHFAQVSLCVYSTLSDMLGHAW